MFSRVMGVSDAANGQFQHESYQTIGHSQGQIALKTMIILHFSPRRRFPLSFNHFRFCQANAIDHTCFFL
jgi:hypothetical protein